MGSQDMVSRRLVLGGAAALVPAAALARQDSDARSNPVAVPLAGPALLDAFMKLRASTDDAIVIGWMQAITHAIIEGETFPLYRLHAATWYRHRRVSPERFEGTSVEVAFFHDVRGGEPLRTLKMPRTGAVVDVPLYRAGPSPGAVMLHQQERREFTMAGETRQGEKFFRPGQAVSLQTVSEPHRDGDHFLVREDLDTRVTPGNSSTPSFFYREWTINKGPWDVVMDPRTHTAPTEVLYSALAAFRPWMKMGATPGHTTQNGRGGKVQRVEDLPDVILDLCRRHHPDLVNEPDKVLAQKPS